MAKDSMIGLAKLSSAVLGTSTMANGFAVTPTGPASLQVVCAPGEIYSLTSIDALAFSTLPADTTHSIMKQGILLDGVTLSCPAPGTTGQSINYLVQVTYQDSDSTPVLLPYYNSANPALPYSGMGNNGLTQNTNRKGIAVVAVKAGASAVTGSQVTPAPDAGYVGLYVVTVAFGQTTITSTSIAQYSAAPLLPSGILQSIQNGNTSFAIDTGTANTYVCNFTPAITARAEGQVLRVKVKTANTSASTFNDGLGAVALVGGAHSPLQGGELIANGDAWVQWNTSVGGGSYILLFCTGAAEQVAPATQSQHALQQQQKGVSRFTASGSFTVPPGVTTIYASGCAGGGGGGSSLSTNASSFVGGGSGGGAGQPAIRIPITVTPGQVIPVTIGAGGNGGTAATNNATDGGATQLGAAGALLNLAGGLKGSLGAGGSTVPGNYGGPGGGVGFPSGGFAQDTTVYAGNIAYGGFGGVGGSGPFGASGPAGRGATGSSPPAGAGFGFGAGGSGAGGAYSSTVVAAGGPGAAGMPGLLIIEW